MIRPKIRSLGSICVFPGHLSLRPVGDPLKGAIVEVYDGISRWGKICPDNWETAHAQYVCQQFGYTGYVAAVKLALQDTQLNNSTNVKFMRVWKCMNPIRSFLSCLFEVSTECDCSELSAGVVCSTSSIGIYLHQYSTVC